MKNLVGVCTLSVACILPQKSFQKTEFFILLMLSSIVESSFLHFRFSYH